MVGIAGLLVAVITAVSLFFDSGSEEGGTDFSAAATGPSPASYSDAPSTAAFKGIEKRSSDARPLTTAEVFNRATKTFKDAEAKVTLELRGSKIDNSCAAAIWGKELLTELTKAGCTQAVRGIYSDDKQRYGAAITILNLAGVAEANAAAKRLSPDVGTGFVLPMPAEAPLDRFGQQGFSVARGRALGHYVIVSWVQRLDGGGDEQDEKLLSLVVTAGEADGALLRRAVR